MGRKFIKPSFSQEQNTEYHRQQCAIVFEFLKFLKENEEADMDNFFYTSEELIHALYDVLYAANKQINYREYIYHRYVKDKDEKEVIGQAAPMEGGRGLLGRLFMKK